ncbi:Follistatin-related protein 1 [Takifugu flavidus]|uniref:Follistatin-related protein 1 n=1 Tax=Takifugu flavidus TaxID=433684 RepID=A0A5C6PRG1_9TELE|nr:Follistatin-related protein 1 [Takifugu flavidus]
MSATETSYECPPAFPQTSGFFPPYWPQTEPKQRAGNSAGSLSLRPGPPSLPLTLPFSFPGHGNVPRSEQGRVENRGAERVGRIEKKRGSSSSQNFMSSSPDFDQAVPSSSRLTGVTDGFIKRPHFTDRGSSMSSAGSNHDICSTCYSEMQSKSKVCANVFCGAGRECAVNEKGEPSCLCIESCKPHKRSVCGSNGKTYRNHCELHRDACLTGLKIQVAHDGHCQERKTEQAAASPVVCYAADRNELRSRVIQWLHTEIVPDGWFAKGSNFSDVLLKYFKVGFSWPLACSILNKEAETSPAAGRKQSSRKYWSGFQAPDTGHSSDKPSILQELRNFCGQQIRPNASQWCGLWEKHRISQKKFDSGDSQMDSSELLKFIQQNESVAELQSYADQESNKLLRSLCVDALIELSDENADWKLSFDEFLNCLKPGFNPPEKKCSLEDETYEDGAETQVECNRCVCACGNWVCTAMVCPDKSAAVGESTDTGAEMTEEEWNLRVAELNKHQGCGMASLYTTKLGEYDSGCALNGMRNGREDEEQRKGGLNEDEIKERMPVITLSPYLIYLAAVHC